MRGTTENDDEFFKRFRRAESLADEKQGRKPQAPMLWLVSSFFAGSLPAYFCLLIAGYNGERLQIPLICAGLVLTGIAYLLIREKQKLWHKEFMQYMERTKPD
ncbi:hypothetical protein H8F21_22105 [Pseudomonas sp. P66]|uniref:Uncharacterized protein n=1 Tax=Pseudomonas arcuscaelestis TaxID=2710591 RepID=A0ABS2C310_9PSED|nr:hypothetical protein [Pseudomonas arcuscaelestis]MBM5460261.1 hypothetical protein [Pseudomonas arcuscaelestis]